MRLDHPRRIIPGYTGKTLKSPDVLPQPLDQDQDHSRDTGKTNTCSPSTAGRSDHPRAYGENVHRIAIWIANYGSSPKRRGKRTPAQGARARGRIIPAHMGETEEEATREKIPGSSPRVRGKRQLAHQVSHCPRIIPAHTGETPAPECLRWQYTDHPRTHGGNLPTVDEQGQEADHPRAYGGNQVCSGHCRRVIGSSPHTRGKREHFLVRLRTLRIIPVYTGET